ncbi:MAG: hypothetical protein JW860_08835 [Sedimentisphaerales bacterium]|nr:hypothetical protein [Sedimentisphaerales bacterium]
MQKGIFQKIVVLVLVCFMLVTLGGCGQCSAGGEGKIKLHPIFESALTGALVGLIVGHQSDEDCNGAWIGAAIGGGGALLSQTDALSGEECVKVIITNPNGSTTPVQLKKKGDRYVGPKGEHYNHLPSADELRPLYGIKE